MAEETPHGGLSVTAREQFQVGLGDHVTFAIDLVVYDSAADSVRWVLDTKYKPAAAPASDDVS